MKRYLPVAPGLAFLRETHGFVLSVTSIGDGNVSAFTVTIDSAEAQRLGNAIADGETWSKDDESLSVEPSGDTVELVFREPATRLTEAVEYRLSLSPTETATFRGALSEL